MYSITDRQTAISSCQLPIGVASYGALGHVPPSTANSLIFQVTSEPHKLWHWTPCGCLSSKTIFGHIALSLFVAWISYYFGVSPFYCLLLVSCPPHKILATPLQWPIILSTVRSAKNRSISAWSRYEVIKSMVACWLTFLAHPVAWRPEAPWWRRPIIHVVKLLQAAYVQQVTSHPTSVQVNISRSILCCYCCYCCCDVWLIHLRILYSCCCDVCGCRRAGKCLRKPIGFKGLKKTFLQTLPSTNGIFSDVNFVDWI